MCNEVAAPQLHIGGVVLVEDDRRPAHVAILHQPLGEGLARHIKGELRGYDGLVEVVALIVDHLDGALQRAGVVVDVVGAVGVRQPRGEHLAVGIEHVHDGLKGNGVMQADGQHVLLVVDRREGETDDEVVHGLEV